MRHGPGLLFGLKTKEKGRNHPAYPLGDFIDLSLGFFLFFFKAKSHVVMVLKVL